MEIVVPDMPARRSGVRRGQVLALLMMLGSLAAACSSSRHTGSSLPGVSASTRATAGSAVDSSPGTSTPGTPASVTVAATTVPPTTAPPTTAPPTTTTLPPTTTTSPPTTTTTPLVTEGATVLVANATKLPGGAGRLSNELAKVGYHMASPTNAAGNEPLLDTTKVYFLSAGEAVATGLATLLGVPLAHMPTPAPIVDATAGLGEATVLVMLGKDFAGRTPPGLRGR